MSYQAILDRATNEGLWLLQETSGSTAEDTSGNDRDGTIFGALTNQTGPNDWLPKAFSFDGVDDYVDCGSAPSPTPGTDSFSLGVWVKPASADEAGYLLGTAEFDGANRGNSLYWDGANNRLVLSLGSATSGQPTSDAVFTEDDKWVFVGVSVTDDQATFYKDGVASGAGTVNSGDSSTQKFLIGNRNGGTSAGTFFSGLMASPLVFSEALSADDWATLAAGPGGVPLAVILDQSMMGC